MRATTKGLKKDVAITVARKGRKRARGVVTEVGKDAAGDYVLYRNGYNGGVYRAALADVKIVRPRRPKLARTLTPEELARDD